jgi:cytochrome P450
MMTMNESQQSAVMKGIGAAFTPNAVLEYEKFIDDSATLLVSQISKQATFDMSKWFQLFAMDVLNRNAFGESPGFLARGEDIDSMLATVEARFKYYNTWAAVPTIEYVLHKNVIARRLGSAINRLANLARAQLEKRRSEKRSSEIHHDLLQKYLDGQAKYPETISDTNVIGLVVSSIAAGADTTATTLTATMFFLMKHPSVRSKLEREIRGLLPCTTIDGTSKPPRASEVLQLPYLDAVIKESMRLFPIIVSGLDRIVPAGGRTIAGTFLPAGTVVACHPESLHRDRDLFGADAQVFNPNRWLDADKERSSKMNQAFLGFGKGKRICPGRHIALLEMKKVIPLLLSTFEVCQRSIRASDTSETSHLR